MGPAQRGVMTYPFIYHLGKVTVFICLDPNQKENCDIALDPAPWCFFFFFAWSLHILGIVTYCWAQHPRDERLFWALSTVALVTYVCIFHFGAVISLFFLHPAQMENCNISQGPANQVMCLFSFGIYCWAQCPGDLTLLPVPCSQKGIVTYLWPGTWVMGLSSWVHAFMEDCDISLAERQSMCLSACSMLTDGIVKHILAQLTYAMRTVVSWASQ